MFFYQQVQLQAINVMSLKATPLLKAAVVYIVL